MEKPVINLHISSLIGKVEIVNVLFDPKTDLTEQNLSQLNDLSLKMESALLEILKKSDTAEEILKKDSSDDIQKKKDH
ncbi:hypothetical protein HER18_07440 [Chryseobacterium sp. NEB161]|nr:hypothetical protein HER18_07440 [Chryseobacterium sp. NEB161]